MKDEGALSVEIDQEIVDAWNKAAVDLGIRVTAPFMLIDENGRQETYEALIHDFGGPRGTLTGKIDRFGPYHGDHTESRSKAGYFASNLANGYRKYDRELFAATLDDWQWFGEEGQQPSWYTGKPWS